MSLGGYFYMFTKYRRLCIINLTKESLNRFTILGGDGGMYMTKERKEPLYEKRNIHRFNLKKLKENAVRVNQVNGKIKLDKHNKADLDWYFG